MAVYKRRYRPYTGELTPQSTRFLVLPKYAFSTIFESKIFLSFFVLCFVPSLIAATVIYLGNNKAALMLLELQNDFRVNIDNYFFARWFMIQGALSFVMAALVGPALISSDLSHDALQLFLSRPLSRVDYLLGKATVLAALISAITWVPGLVLFTLQASLVEGPWLGKNFYILGAIFMSAWLWIGVLALLSLALSAWVKWRIAATGLMFAVFVVTPGFGEAINEVLRTNWGHVLSLGHMVRVVWFNLFRLPLTPQQSGAGSPTDKDLPVWVSWIGVLALCSICVFLLNTRLKAREVVRG